MDFLARHRGLLTFEGILFIILGCLAIAVPQFFTLAIEIFIGWLFIAAGLFLIFRLFQTREIGFWPTVLSAILNVGIGVLLLAYPIAGIFSLTLLLIAYFVIDGFSKIVFSFHLRPRSNWGWLLTSGILSLLLAGLLLGGWPGTAAWALGLLVGINMLFTGFSLVAFASSLKKV
ncbi:MAG: HdeD family acid-resistance protein [Parachlamydiaceae bacterium]